MLTDRMIYDKNEQFETFPERYVVFQANAKASWLRED